MAKLIAVAPMLHACRGLGVWAPMATYIAEPSSRESLLLERASSLAHTFKRRTWTLPISVSSPCIGRRDCAACGDKTNSLRLPCVVKTLAPYALILTRLRCLAPLLTWPVRLCTYVVSPLIWLAISHHSRTSRRQSLVKSERLIWRTCLCLICLVQLRLEMEDRIIKYTNSFLLSQKIQQYFLLR
jgi:hypothetical protein